ncbi:MAG TPA: hypothetical protein VM577_00700 [Anaerovoracaceae bacterium]|nr:hypothetical protein [Anaerovoracaceae bacterium]
MSDSNLLGMKRNSPRSDVAQSKVHHAWHQARNRKVVKKTLEDGSVIRTVTISPGQSLKTWAREQVKSNGPHAVECDLWLNSHKAGKVERAAMAERKKTKGGMLAQIAAATKSAKKSKKKGSAPSTEKSK